MIIRAKKWFEQLCALSGLCVEHHHRETGIKPDNLKQVEQLRNMNK